MSFRTVFLKKADRLLKHPEELFFVLTKALKKAYDKRGVLLKVWEDFLTLFRLVKAWVVGDYRDVPQKTILWAVFAILYFLSPIDLIPDFLPGGYIDDILVINWVTKRFKGDLDKFKEWERARKEKESPGGN